MSKFFRYLSIAFASSLIFSLLTIGAAKAQYDSEGFPEEPGEEEVFGINIEKGETATFFPGNCEIVDSIKLKAKEDIRGSISMRSFGDDNPTESDKGLGKKVVEFCGIEFEGFTADNIESSVFQLKGDKERMEELKLKNTDARFFQFNVEGDKWEQRDTQAKSDTSVSYFFETDSVGQYSYYALGEKTSAISTVLWVVIICAFLLLLLLIIFLIISSLGRRESERESLS